MSGFANNLIGRDSPLDRVKRRLNPAVRAVQMESKPDTRTEAGHGPVRVLFTPFEEQLLAEIMAGPVDYMPHEDFARPGAERRIYDQAPPVRRPDVTWYRPLMDDFGSKNGTARKHDSVLLTAAEERVLFMQYNFARYRVRTLQDQLGGRTPDEGTAREMLRWYRTARRYREQIAETNLALVLAMAKRVRLNESDFGDLISEGNMALMRSVDKFDCARGFKFSTYACRAILKAFSRHGLKLAKHRQRFPAEFDPAMEKSNHLETVREQHAKESAAEVRHIVESNRAELNDIERAVIVHRFGLDQPQDAPQLTLEQVGQLIGVTKERVRQIQNRALEKIKLALEGVHHPGQAVDERLGVASVN
ncbi:MAG: sigma-70 family RNA polymerase sigma factor [Phycisphaerales bacterium]